MICTFYSGVSPVPSALLTPLSKANAWVIKKHSQIGLATFPIFPTPLYSFFLPHQLTKHVLYTIELRTSVEIETVWVKGTTHSEIVNYNHFYTTFHHRLQYLLSEYLQGGWECPVAGRLSGDIGHSIRHIASDFSCSRRDQALNVFCVTRLPID